MAIDLRKIPTLPPEDMDKQKAERQARAFGAEIGQLSEQFAAVGKKAMLVIFQGMDASGKDGGVKAAFGQATPLNLRVSAWKKPTELEMRHDFLWRINQAAPAKGEIAIWNRSHYEDVLIQRVHGWIDEERVTHRIEAINAFEKLLQFDNDTIIIKFMLHTSKEEQEQQLQERINDPAKHHKHNANDWEERRYWDQYIDAYNDVLNRSAVPWVIVPTDKRWYRDYLVSKTIRQALVDLQMEWPPLPESR